MYIYLINGMVRECASGVLAGCVAPKNISVQVQTHIFHMYMRVYMHTYNV